MKMLEIQEIRDEKPVRNFGKKKIKVSIRNKRKIILFNNFDFSSEVLQLLMDIEEDVKILSPDTKYLCYFSEINFDMLQL